jgi:hypothetical protein
LGALGILGVTCLLAQKKALPKILFKSIESIIIIKKGMINAGVLNKNILISYFISSL